MYRFFLIFCITSMACISLQAKNTNLAMDSIPEMDIFVIVEQMPVFPGGEKAMLTFIKENLQYPIEAKNNKVQGTVYLKFVVLPDGSLHDIKIIRAIAPDFGINEEALRIVQSMPKWNPGRQRGRPVAVYYTLPMRFRLDTPNKPGPITDNDKPNKPVSTQAIDVNQNANKMKARQKVKMEGLSKPPAHPSTNAPDIAEGEGIELDKVGSDGIPVYKTVPEMPYYGTEEKEKFFFIGRNTKYPPEARKKSVQGTVYLGFIVMEDGSIQQVHVKRGVPGGKLCDEEAMRVIRSFPNWHPGKIDGKPVRVAITMPVRFKLEGRSGRPNKVRKIRKIR